MVEAAEVLGLAEAWLILPRVTGGCGVVGFLVLPFFRNITISRQNSGCVVCVPVSDFYFAPKLFLQLFRVETYFFFGDIFVGKGRFWASFHNGVFLSGFVPNLAMLLSRTLTSGAPGSRIAVVVDVCRTVLPGTKYPTVL